MPDYTNFFSADTQAFMPSPVREIFRRVRLEDIYSFAGGYPPSVAFPVDALKAAVDMVLDTRPEQALQYGATQGVPVLRQLIAVRYDVPVERVQITTSSQQGIDVCTRVLVDPGDVILTSNPTYLGALQSFKSYRADIQGVSYNSSSGKSYRQQWADRIETILGSGRRIKFLYMIPDFQNPSGETLTLPQRQALVSLAQEFDFLIVEDSPYRDLRYEGEHLPTLYSLAPERVLHLGSFSKVLAPGLRLGWVLAAPELLEKIYVCKQALDLCPPMLEQYVAAELLGNGVLDDNISCCVTLYRHKRDFLLGLLEEYMPEGVSWTHPEGGLFLFLYLWEGFDSVAFYEQALSAGVAYVAGSFFHTDGSGKNTMRLNFSFLPESKMRPGIALLSDLLRKMR